MRKIALAALAVALFIVGAGLILSYIYKDEVKRYVVTAINERLNSEIEVGSIDLDLFSQFPRAALRFSKLTAGETWGKAPADTLFHAESLYLKFGWLDLLQKKYSIEALRIEGGVIHLKRDAADRVNYTFWDNKSDTTSSNRVEFALEQVEIRNTRFTYEDEGEKLAIGTDISSIDSEGKLRDGSFDLRGDLDLSSADISVAAKKYLNNHSIAGDIELTWNEKKNSLRIAKSGLEVNSLPISATGTYAKTGNSYTLDFKGRLKGSATNILASLPAPLKPEIANYEPQGELVLNYSVSKADGDKQSVVFTTDFMLDDGRFTEKESGVHIENISAKGHYNSGKGGWDALDIENCKGDMGLGEFSLNGSIQNLNRPTIDLDVEALLDLAEVHQFFRVKSVEEMSGEVDLNCTLAGQFYQDDNKKWGFIQRESGGKMDLKDVAIRPSKEDVLLSIKSGQVMLNNHDAAVQDIEGTIATSTFALSGFARNLIPYLLNKGEQLDLEAKFTSPELNLDKILASNPKSRSDTSYSLILPENVSADLEAQIDRLTFRRFAAEEISCKAQLREGLASIKPITMKTAGGSLDASVNLRQPAKRDIKITCQVELHEIGMADLFYAFEDFGQRVVQSKHLGGIATAEGVFEASMSNSLKIDLKSVRSITDVTILEGRLKNLETLQEIADYVKGNGLLAPFVDTDALASNLADVKFSTLENQIRVENEVVHIPSMEIRSNAMDINASGSHGFDNRIDYKINFKLGELLTTGKPEESEFGWVADDGTGTTIFMSMTGMASNPEFSLDKNSAREHRKAVFQREKKNLKSILKEELGLFKSDTTLTEPEALSDKPKAKYDIEWDGFGKDKEKADSTTTGKKEKKKKKSFWEKLGGGNDEPEKVKKEIDPEDDDI